MSQKDQEIELAKVQYALEREDAYLDDEGDGNYDLSFTSKAGEDFHAALFVKEQAADSLVDELASYAGDFDEAEHAASLYEAGKNGFAGVPSLAVLVEDAQWIQRRLNELVEVARESLSDREESAV